MNKKNPLGYPIVIITWEDHTSEDGWIHEEELGKSVGHATIVSVGWLVAEDKKSYTIASGKSVDKDVSNDFTALQHILKGTVVSKKVLVK